MLKDNVISIVFVHYAYNPARSELGKRCLKQVQETTKHLPVELIVVDNGGSLEDSEFFLKETEAKRITHYIRNADNLWYLYARNQGFDMATGNYLCSIDNDILVEKGWLDECISVLKNAEGKHFITPLRVDKQHRWEKYYRKPVFIGEKKYATNALAGSSCFIMPKEAWKEIGHFSCRRLKSAKWHRKQSRVGYSVIILPEPKARNFGTKNTPYKGHRFHVPLAETRIKKHFTNGESIILNE